MVKLDLTAFQDQLRCRASDQGAQIWDMVRHKWLILAPEEMVRQLVVQYLVACGYSNRLIQVEKQIEYGGLKRRFDVVAYRSAEEPFLLIECKAPHIGLNQTVFDQIARYNLTLRVPYLWVTNGKENFCCQLDSNGQKYFLINYIPFPDMQI